MRLSPLVFLVGSLLFTLAFNVAWALPAVDRGASFGEWLGAVHWLSVIAAAVCTLIVPAGLHLWPMVPVHGDGWRWWVRWLLRAVVMSGICVAALITSFSHSVSVLIAAGWTDWTAWSVTGGAELLVALSTMAAMSTDTVDGQARATDNDQPSHARTPAADATDKPRAGTADNARSGRADTPAATPVPPATVGAVQAADSADRTDRLPNTGSRTTTPFTTHSDDAGSGVEQPRRIDLVHADRMRDLRQWVKELGEVPSESKVRTRYRCRQTVARKLLDELAADIDSEADGGHATVQEPAAAVNT